MIGKYEVLIIDEYQLTIDSYKKALKLVEGNIENILFNIKQAKTCQSALDILDTYSSKCILNLVFLDISLLPTCDKRFLSGECIGKEIKNRFNEVKIISCTSFSDNLRLNNIIKSINPNALLIKGEIDFNDVTIAINKVLLGNSYYSETVLNLFRNKLVVPFTLDSNDIKILYEISNGARMKDLLLEIPLSKAGIIKRKQIMKELFNTNTNDDRELICVAKDKGFI